MTYLEILGWARKGIQADKAKHREMQEKALEGQALDIARHCQEVIDALDVKLATLDEIEHLHNSRHEKKPKPTAARHGKSKVSNQTRKRWRGFSLPNLPRSRADTSRVPAAGR